MRRRLSLLFLALAYAFVPATSAKEGEAPPTPDQQLDAKIAKHRAETGKAHFKLAKWCRTKKYLESAHVHWVLGLHFNPNDRTARRTLGYKKVDGAWVLKKPVDMEKVKDQERPTPEYQERDDEIRADRLKGLMKLAETAQRLGLESRAEELMRAALKVNPYDGDIRKALGHVQIGGQWFTPDEAKALSAKIEIELAKGVTQIAATAALKVQQYRSGQFYVEGDGSEEEFRYILEAENRTVEFLNRIHGREWLRKDVQIPFLAWGEKAKYDAWIDANVTDASMKRFAKQSGGMRHQAGSMVGAELAGRAQQWADRMVHIMAQHGTRVSRNDPWLLQGFTDYVSGRIVGSMALRFVKLESSGGNDGGGSKLAGAVWRRRLRRVVALGKDGITDALFSSSLNGLENRDLMKSWSIVDFLYERDSTKISEFISGAEGGATVDSLEDVYGMTVDELEKEWRAHVIEYF